MSLEKLVNIRQRLSQLTEPESDNATSKSDRELKSKNELMAVIQALDEVIGEYKREWLINTNLERELQRTTGRPLQPPTEPQPHEIQWQGANITPGPNPGPGTNPGNNPGPRPGPNPFYGPGGNIIG